MKAITLKDFVPQDPIIKLLLKRIALIFIVHSALGTIAAFFGLEYPVLIFIGLLLATSFLGLFHWLSVNESEEQKKASFEQLVLTALLTVIACLSLLIPLLLITPALGLLAFSGLCFGSANLISVLVVLRVNKPVFVPEKAVALDWLQAFIETLILDHSSFFIIFKIHDGNKTKVVKQAVDNVKLYQQTNVTLQRLLSNFICRYNVKVISEKQILTDFTANQVDDVKYEYSFYQLRFLFFKKFLSPFSPFCGLKCAWKHTILRDDYNQKWRLARSIVIHVQRHEPQLINTSSTDELKN